MALRPRPPCAFSHRKISHEPAQIPPKSGGSPHAHDFSHPSFSNHTKLSWMLETLRIGVIRFGCMCSSASLKGRLLLAHELHQLSVDGVCDIDVAPLADGDEVRLAELARRRTRLAR